MTNLFSRPRLSGDRRHPFRACLITGASLRAIFLQIGLYALALGAATPLFAACVGVDLRESAPRQMMAEVEAELAETPYAKGISWIATRSERRLHIIGTMHLNDPRHDALAAQMTPAITVADAVLLEVNRADKSNLNRALSESPSLVFITEGATLIDLLPPDEWQQIADRAGASGIPPFMAAKMRPWFLSLSMSVPQCARAIEDVTDGLDMKLMTVAETAGVPTLSLEDPLLLFQKLDAAPLEQQIADLRSYIAMTGVGPDDFYTMVESYFDGDVQEYTLLQLKQFLAAESDVPVRKRQAQVDELLETLLYQRNRDWIPVIEATEGARVVIAVGAAHLPGDQGLLALLEREGYRIEEAPL